MTRSTSVVAIAKNLLPAVLAVLLVTSCGVRTDTGATSPGPTKTASVAPPTASTSLTTGTGPDAAQRSSAKPTAPPTAASRHRGSGAAFKHYDVTVRQLKHRGTSQLLVLAKVCVTSIVPGTQWKKLRISWGPWSVKTGSRTTRAKLSGQAPKGVFPSDDTYRKGECASGWIPFDTTGEPDSITYANGAGDTAVWDAGRLDAKPTTYYADKSDSPEPRSTERSTQTPTPPTTKPREPRPDRSPTWDGHGYTKGDYKDRVDDIPEWIGLVRKDYADGMDMTVGVDFRGLQHRFEEVAVLPAPPHVDPAYWYASTTTLERFAEMAADEWDNGDSSAALARLEVIVENSNNLVTKVNKAFDLHIRKSK